MPLKLIRDDITKLSCDAIVNAANHSLLGGGGVDGAIHRVAGKKLLLECMRLHGCKIGEAKITKGYNLPSKYVIHTVGPIWRGGNEGEEENLRLCYRNSLEIAREREFETIAFPLISSGAYGYPKDEALKIAIDEITDFLTKNEMLVYLVIFDKSTYQISKQLFDDIALYIDSKYTDEEFEFLYDTDIDSDSRLQGEMSQPLEPTSRFIGETNVLNESRPVQKRLARVNREISLNDALNSIDESFSEMLLRKIDEKGMTDAECYKKANIDRKLFSKIRGDKLYRPSKTTALAFAIALELPLEEVKDMLMKAGFALSHSNKFDIIIEYFITKGNYNVFEINEALFAFDQNLLGV